jgi:hypothetical protein
MQNAKCKMIMKQILFYLLADGLLLPLFAPRAAAQGGGVTGVKATFVNCRFLPPHLGAGE